MINAFFWINVFLAQTLVVKKYGFLGLNGICCCLCCGKNREAGNAILNIQGKTGSAIFLQQTNRCQLTVVASCLSRSLNSQLTLYWSTAGSVNSYIVFLYVFMMVFSAKTFLTISKATALWADAFYKLICPSVCSLLKYQLNIFLPPLPVVRCPILLEIPNPWGKVM